MKLDLCCGPEKPKGYFGIDKIAFPGVDKVWDLNDGIPIPNNDCEEVRAHDAIEHIEDGMKLMRGIWRVLVDGGRVDILVPSTDGRGAFQDLTHISFWNENSFKYWINPAIWMDYYRGPCLFACEALHTTDKSEDGVCHVVFRGRAVKHHIWIEEYYKRNPE